MPKVPYLTIEGALRRHRQLGQTVPEQNVQYLLFMLNFIFLTSQMKNKDFNTDGK